MFRIKTEIIGFGLLLFCLTQAAWSQNALVFQTDFGLEEPAVASMKGVAYGVSADLRMFDITHEIPVFNIWEAAYRLDQTAQYWPSGTVFVSVVDPGVGTDRRSVVLKTNSGHYFVSPDNGSLTLVAETLGTAELREIDEAVNRLKGSEKSHTFHGRDVYAYTGARLAAGIISFEQVGPRIPARVVNIAYQRAELKGGVLRGGIPILDPQYGNVWTNIPGEMIAEAGITVGQTVCVKISKGADVRLEAAYPYVSSFGDVALGDGLLYLNSLFNLSLALNQSNFATKHQIGSGAQWNIQLRPCA